MVLLDFSPAVVPYIEGAAAACARSGQSRAVTDVMMNIGGVVAGAVATGSIGLAGVA